MRSVIARRTPSTKFLLQNIFVAMLKLGRVFRTRGTGMRRWVTLRSDAPLQTSMPYELSEASSS